MVIKKRSAFSEKMDKDLYNLLLKKRKERYKDPKSILKKYEKFLESHFIYYSLNKDFFRESIKGRVELCDGILRIYKEAQLDNERISLLYDLMYIGYDKDKLVELILSIFDMKGVESGFCDLWAYSDLLYILKNFKYMTEYINIVKNKSLGEGRQMLVLLLGKSKDENVIPLLKDLLDDDTVHGHALEALSKFKGTEIVDIMEMHSNYPVTWIRNIAKRYLSKNKNQK